MIALSKNTTLLNQILAAAASFSLGQKQLAIEAGLKPKNLSRANKCSDMKLSTLSRLAEVVGLLEGRVPVSEPNTSPTGDPAAVLSAPHCGLVCSNLSTPEDVLLRTALIKIDFTAILEPAAVDGIDFVRRKIQVLRDANEIDTSKESKLLRILKSIERGFNEENRNSS